MSTDDGCTLASSNGSMTMRPALSCSRIVLSDRITRGSLPARLGIFVAPRGCSSEAEHQLPKLRTRVRFPSPALGGLGTQAASIVIVGQRPFRVTPRVGIMRDEDEERVRHLLRAACDRDLLLAHRVEYA